MNVYLTPGIFAAGGQVLDKNGVLVSGALVNIYAAGTSSQVSTFTTSAANVTTANPLVSDAEGRLSSEIWQTEGQALKIVLTDALANVFGNYDNLYGIGDPYASSGIAILGKNNKFTGQNTFTNISANAITVTSIVANNISADNINSLSVTSLTVTTLNVTSVFVSNLTISGNVVLFNQLLGRTVTGTVVATNLGPGGVANSTPADPGLGTNEYEILLSVTSTVNTNYMAYARRPDGSVVISRGILSTTTANAPGTGSSFTLGVFNNHTATQTFTINYMVIG